MASPSYDFTNGEFSQNITRVNNLISAYEHLVDENIGGKEMRDDVLRAAVVLLHSSLEEMIRNLFLKCLEDASQETLNKIPFITQSGENTKRQPEKFSLGDLIEFKGRFVDNVIRTSIEKYVDKMNISSAKNLASCLEMVSISPKKFQSGFSTLEKLMKRRHQIVHQMDRINDLDTSPKKPASKIKLAFVRNCRRSLESFYKKLNEEVKKLYPD